MDTRSFNAAKGATTIPVLEVANPLFRPVTTKTRSRRIAAFIIGILLAASLISSPQSASAAPVVGFQPGNIIDDSVFYDKATMTEASIQAFLTAKGANCSVGALCLKNYAQSTVDRPTDAMCKTYIGEANDTAARIIYKVSQACGINPRVLIVMLEKEQGLVTTQTPTASKYRIAMGYGCDDITLCDAQYFGFFNQVYKAAWQLIRYTNPAGTSKYFTWYGPGITADIKWHPNASCGAGKVHVTNQATASLYYYTPYQPNAAAIKAGTGKGDECSAYGNRNFYSFFTAWFGSVRGAGTPDTTTTVSRLSGADRYLTAVDISKQSFPSGVPVVYVATGLSFPDALAAGPAAAVQGGPLLLTTADSVPAPVSEEIKRLKPANIVVVGGTNAVSAAAYNQLKALAPSIRRDAGADRLETSRVIIQNAFPGGSATTYVATAWNFPDALAASAAAGAVGAPVALVDGNATAVDPHTAALISTLKAKKAVVTGGTSVVSPAIERSLTAILGSANVTRLGGDDRYATATAINVASFTKSDTVYLANGSSFADALAGAALAGAVKAPLYTVQAHCVPNHVVDDIKRLGATKIVLLGGVQVLTAGVASLTACS